MKLQINLSLILFFLLFTSSLYTTERAQKITLKSAVVFNTLCAKCHEGGCSGRLSFDTGKEAASNHIKRYADSQKISKLEVKEYFTLLNFMKKDCLLFMPKSAKWSLKNSLDFATPSHKQYFIPLGELQSGNYQLQIQTKKDINFRFEIISNQFDSYINQAIYSDNRKEVFTFLLEENTNCFLRIHSKKPLYIKSLMFKLQTN